MVAWYCIVFASIVWFWMPLVKVAKRWKFTVLPKITRIMMAMVVCLKLWLFTLRWYCSLHIKERWQRWWLVVLNHGKIQWSYNTAARRSCSSLQSYLFTMDRLICYYICALIDNCILNPLSPMQLKYFVHYTDCL